MTKIKILIFHFYLLFFFEIITSNTEYYHYLILQSSWHILFTLPYRVWYMQKKCCLFCLVFSKYLKNDWNYFEKKKIERNHDVLVYKKALMSEQRKNYVLRDINDFVKMSVCTLVCTLPNSVYALAQKLATISKTKFGM